jgi:hypothetical protein
MGLTAGKNLERIYAEAAVERVFIPLQRVHLLPI